MGDEHAATVETCQLSEKYMADSAGFNDGCFPVVIEPLLILHESRGIITWQDSERTSWPTDHRGAACTVSITRACSSLLSTRGDTTGAPVSVRKKGVCL